MAGDQNSTSGFIAFFVLVAILFAGLLTAQETIFTFLIDWQRPVYEVYPDIIAPEWIILERIPPEQTALRRVELLRQLQTSTKMAKNPRLQEALVKASLRDFEKESKRTIYFLNPYIAFAPLYLFVSIALSFLFSMFFPAGNRLSWIRHNLDRVLLHIESVLRKQFESHDIEFESTIALEPDARAAIIRESTLPEVITTEVNDFIAAKRWTLGRGGNPFVPLKFYFRYHMAVVYGNMIQGVVAGGAAVLIFVIGLRGVKLISQEEPSLILMSLSLEFILLLVLMITFAGSAQEERLDRVVKELEAEQRDAINEQTEMFRTLLNKVVVDGSKRHDGESLADFEEKKMIEETLALLIAQAEKKKNAHGA